MREIVDAIADSIEPEFSDFKAQRHDPIWHDPAEGRQLFVFGVRMFPGDFRTTGTREDVYEVAVRIIEPIATADETLVRDEAAELEFSELATTMRAWADQHQSLEGIHRLDYVSLSFAPDVRQEAFVRYAEMTLHARKNATYG